MKSHFGGFFIEHFNVIKDCLPRNSVIFAIILEDYLIHRKMVPIFGRFLGNTVLGTKWQSGDQNMRKKNYKGRCEKRTLSKCPGICKTYDPVQSRFADSLQTDANISAFRCNVPLDGLDIGEYTSDFVCTLENGGIMVRECVSKNHLTKPITAKLLDISRNYWMNHGVTDWGLVINAEK